MPLFYADLVPGSGTYLYQETLYRSESCKRRLRRTAPCGPPGMATQARPAYRRRYLCSSIACISMSGKSPTKVTSRHDLSCLLGLKASNQTNKQKQQQQQQNRTEYTCKKISPKCQCSPPPPPKPNTRRLTLTLHGKLAAGNIELVSNNVYLHNFDVNSRTFTAVLM